MRRRFALWGLLLLPVFLAQNFGADRVFGDQIFPSASRGESYTSCRVANGADCTRFEGYVVVPKRAGGAEAAARAVVKPDAVLSANRLYLPIEDDKTP